MNIKTVKQLSLVGVYETEAKIPVVKVPQQTVSLLLYNSQSLNQSWWKALLRSRTEANSII
jgi:hypothetical protein